jgi:hypothetical protein
MTLAAFADAFNIFNQQTEIEVDEDYTFDSVNPIVGGDQEDLKHLKRLDDNTGLATSGIATVNPNYGNKITDQAPFAMRFGLRLTF